MGPLGGTPSLPLYPPRAPKKPLYDRQLLVVPDDGTVGEFWDATCSDTPNDEDGAILLDEDPSDLEPGVDKDDAADAASIQLELQEFGGAAPYRQ